LMLLEVRRCSNKKMPSFLTLEHQDMYIGRTWTQMWIYLVKSSIFYVLRRSGAPWRRLPSTIVILLVHRYFLYPKVTHYPVIFHKLLVEMP
jgi:hypothetical protein